VPISVPLLAFAAAAVGQSAIAGRLTDSLQVDVTKTRSLLGWVPRTDIDEGLWQTARSFQRLDLYLDPQARTA
jgi:nucleoside-diphosphate-sugar epimerase